MIDYLSQFTDGQRLAVYAVVMFAQVGVIFALLTRVPGWIRAARRHPTVTNRVQALLPGPTGPRRYLAGPTPPRIGGAQ